MPPGTKWGGVLPEPNGVAGGGLSANVKDARGFEIGLVGPSA